MSKIVDGEFRPVSKRGVTRRGFLHLASGASLAFGLNLAAPSVTIAAGEGQSVRRPKDPNEKPIFVSHEPSILGERLVRYNPNRDWGDLITTVGSDLFSRLAVMEANVQTGRFASLKDDYNIPDANIRAETYLIKRIAGGDFQVMVSLSHQEPPFGLLLTEPFNLETATQIKEIVTFWDQRKITGFGILDGNKGELPIRVLPPQ